MAHRIDGADHVANLFSDNGPGPATVITDDWLNDMQEEVCLLIEAMGVTLVKGTRTQLRDSCVAAATALKIMRRDAAGRAKVADPSAADDIDTKGARDAALTTHAGVTSTHGATAAATADRIVLRDADGKARVASPSVLDDANTVDTVGARNDAISAAPTDGKAGITWSWTQNQTSTRLYRTADGIVHLHIGANVPAGTPALIATLPAGFRPEALMVVPAINASTNAASRFTMGTDGTITCGVARVLDEVHHANVTFRAA